MGSSEPFPAVPRSALIARSRNAGNAGVSLREVFLVRLAVRSRVLLGIVEAERVAADHAIGVLIAVARVLDQVLLRELEEIGRASCRERGEVSVGAVTVNKTKGGGVR